MNSDDTHSALFSRPEDDARAHRSWKSFHKSGDYPHDALRRIVGDSWRRCQSAQVDPSRHQAPLELLGPAVDELQERHRDLLEAGKPVMALARDFLSDTGTLMVLADPVGTVLDVEGDYRTLSPAEKIHLLPGAVWNEVHCGTNAIGTALSLEQPIQIHSEEHYCEGIKRWTCSAAIIRHPCTQLVLGVLDISGLSKTYNRQSLSLVVNSASRIESHLAEKELLLRYRLLDRCLAYMSGDSGSIVLDRYGFPIKLNEHASTALALLGVTLDLGKPARIAGMAIDQKSLPPSGDVAPTWLRTEWVEPIIEGGQRVGTLIRLPIRNARRSIFQSESSVGVLPPTFSNAIGTSKALRTTIIKAAHLAKSRAPILLLGETGTGKEVFAKSIHSSSPLGQGPFIALNCGSLSKDLLASELFGHREGAFTGSRRGGMVGKIEAADGGTLFLDELGEMPLDLQPQFLRVLEDGCVVRLGDNTPKKINFRLISATNRDLRKEVSEGRFRMDLFYRISVTCLQLPALRDRSEDVPILADHFLHQLCEFHGARPKRFAPDAMTRLQQYPWPGNVRELRNVVESSVLTVMDEVIELDDLPAEVRLGQISRAPDDAGERPTQRGVLEQAEFDQIFRALEKTSGNATLAAQQLGIAKSTLYVKLKKYGLEGHLQSSRH